MARLLVFQHVAYEILGTLDPLLKSRGFRIRYINFGRHPHAEPSLDGYDGIIVLGGPMNVDETDRYPHLWTELRLLEGALERNMPILGICLGAQLLAKTLGATVHKSPEPEIGWYTVRRTNEARHDKMFSHLTDEEILFQWHGDAFTIPAGATRLAHADICEHQAFRYGDNAYGLQFHMEVDEPMIERWLGIPSLQADLARVAHRNDAHAIRAATQMHIVRLKDLSQACFGEFANLFPVRRKRLLPSR